MHKVQHPLCVLMLVTRNGHETSKQIAIYFLSYIVLRIEKMIKKLDYSKYCVPVNCSSISSLNLENMGLEMK